MADNKKSFLLYCDLIHTVKKLPKEKQGELFITILEYVNDMNPEVKDLNVDLVFEPIKRQLKRDLIKYEGKKKQWSEAGKASAKARKKKSTTVNDRSTDSTVTVNDTVNVNVNVNDNVIKENILYSQTWIEQICMKKKLEIKDVTEYLNIFLDDLDLKGELDKPEKDIKSHFVNWLNVEIKKEKSSAKKENPKTIEDEFKHLI